MNRAQEPRLRGGSSVAVALYATAGLVSEHVRFLGARLCLKLTRMDCGPAGALKWRPVHSWMGAKDHGVCYEPPGDM